MKETREETRERTNLLLEIARANHEIARQYEHLTRLYTKLSRIYERRGKGNG